MLLLFDVNQNYSTQVETFMHWPANQKYSITIQKYFARAEKPSFL